MSLNDQLKSKLYKSVTVAIDGHLVEFDGNGHCKGAVRRSGEPHPHEPEEITLGVLREAKKRENEFTVEDEPEAPKKAASTRKAKAAKVEAAKTEAAPVPEATPEPEIAPVKAEPVEVEGAKTVTDDAPEQVGATNFTYGAPSLMNVLDGQKQDA